MLFESVLEHRDHKLGVKQLGSQILSFNVLKLEKCQLPGTAKVANQGPEESKEHGRVVKTLLQLRIEIPDFHIMIQRLEPFEPRRIRFGAQMQVHIGQFDQNRVRILPENRQLGQEICRRLDHIAQSGLQFRLQSFDPFGPFFGNRARVGGLDRVVKRLLAL